MTVTNLTDLANMSATGSLVTFIDFIDDASNGVFLYLFILILSIIIFMIVLRNLDNVEKSLLVTCFIMLIVSAAMASIGLITFTIVITFGVIFVMSGFFVYFNTRNSY